jgi:hypothetical protein
MGLISRIAEEQGVAKQEAQGAKVDAQVEQSKPDAKAMHDESRNAYSQAITEGNDADITEETPTGADQKMFTEIEKAMAEKIYSNASASNIVKAVQAGGDPVNSVGQLAAAMVSTMTGEFPDMSEDVMMAVGESAVEQIVDLAESADDTINLTDDQMAEALSIGVTLWMDQNPEKMDGGDLQSYQDGEAPVQLQQGGKPNGAVTNQNQGAEPTPEEVAAAGAAQEGNSGAPIARI